MIDGGRRFRGSVHDVPIFGGWVKHQQYVAKNPNGYCGIGGTGMSCPVGVAKTDQRWADTPPCDFGIAPTTTRRSERRNLVGAIPKWRRCRAHTDVYVGGYEAAPGHPRPEPPVPEGPRTVEEWNGNAWVVIGTVQTRSDLATFGVE